jgi:hypothetical protein
MRFYYTIVDTTIIRILCRLSVLLFGGRQVLVSGGIAANAEVTHFWAGEGLASIRPCGMRFVDD